MEEAQGPKVSQQTRLTHMPEAEQHDNVCRTQIFLLQESQTATMMSPVLEETVPGMNRTLRKQNKSRP